MSVKCKSHTIIHPCTPIFSQKYILDIHVYLQLKPARHIIILMDTRRKFLTLTVDLIHVKLEEDFKAQAKKRCNDVFLYVFEMKTLTLNLMVTSMMKWKRNLVMRRKLMIHKEIMCVIWEMRMVYITSYTIQ